jgi:hypothetical protein
MLLAAGCVERPAGTPNASPLNTTSAKAAPATTVGNNPVSLKPKAEGTAKPDPATQRIEDSSSPEEAKSEKPAKRLEPLFVGWPEPQYVLFITGQQYGYIEPCGCAGLANMKGGLARRFSCQRQLVERGWKVIPLDVGNQVRRFGPQQNIKFQVTMEGFKQIGYRAIGFGPDDLRLSAYDLAAITASDGDAASPYVCANVAILDPELMPRFQIIEAAGRKIGVTAVVGTPELARIASDEIIKKKPDEALREVWPELQKARCDLYVLLAHASIDESQKLAQQFPRFDVVVTAGGAGEPTYEAEKIPNTDAIMVQVGTKGMYVGVVGVFDDPRQPLRYQRVPLDSRFPDSPEMLQLLASYQKQLETAGLEGLGIKPVADPNGRTFVGSKACQECHEDEYAVWKKTTHAHALDTLIKPGERTEIPRHFDPECISCHVVGWNPQQNFPYVSGYLGVDETPLMRHVGCENCHNPGSAHVAAENGDIDVDDAKLEELQKEVTLKKEDAEKKCMECHDLDNSPEFHTEGAFEKYWEKVKH